MYNPKFKNIRKLNAYLEKKKERPTNTKRRCTRVK